MTDLPFVLNRAAAGVGTRLDQLREAFAATTPNCVASRLWNVASAARDRFSDLRGSEERAPAHRLAEISPQVVKEKLALGFRAPPHPSRSLALQDRPLSAYRLLGHAMQASGTSLQDVFAAWSAAETARGGPTGARSQALSHGTGKEGIDLCYHFGVALADMAVGLAAMPIPGIDPGFRFTLTEADALPTVREHAYRTDLEGVGQEFFPADDVQRLVFATLQLGRHEHDQGFQEDLSPNADGRSPRELEAEMTRIVEMGAVLVPVGP